MCENYNRQYGCNFISVMPTNLYGPSDNYDLETSHVLPALLRKFHEAKLKMENSGKGGQSKPVENSSESVQNPDKPVENRSELVDNEPVELWGTGTPKREFLHVDDLAEACYHLMQTYEGNISVNIGTGKDISIKDLAILIKEITGFQGEVIWNTDKPDGTPRKQLDVSLMQSLGWSYKIELEEGILQVYQEFFN